MKNFVKVFADLGEDGSWPLAAAYMADGFFEEFREGSVPYDLWVEYREAWIAFLDIGHKITAELEKGR